MLIEVLIFIWYNVKYGQLEICCAGCPKSFKLAVHLVYGGDIFDILGRVLGCEAYLT